MLAEGLPLSLCQTEGFQHVPVQTQENATKFTNCGSKDTKGYLSKSNLNNSN